MRPYRPFYLVLTEVFLSFLATFVLIAGTVVTIDIFMDLLNRGSIKARSRIAEWMVSHHFVRSA